MKMKPQPSSLSPKTLPSEKAVLLGGKCNKFISLGRVAEAGQYHDWEVRIDAEYPHVCFLCGKRGSGKSYTMGDFAEGLASTDNGVILVDPIGIFWSLAVENRNAAEVALLKNWGIQPRGFPVKLYKAGKGEAGTGAGQYFHRLTLTTSDLEAEDWCLMFGIKRFQAQGLLLGRAIELVRQGYLREDGSIVPACSDYGIGEIIACVYSADCLINGISKFVSMTRRALGARLESVASFGIFARQGTRIEELSKASVLTIVDISSPRLEISLKCLIVGILARNILKSRMEAVQRMEQAGIDKSHFIPPTWLLVDEVHLMVPRNGETAASSSLIEYAKLGRKPGCALVLATQRPAATSDEILSQLDILVGHSLALEDDILSFVKRTPAKMPFGEDDLRGLGTAEAIIADHKTHNRAFKMTVRPRMSHHAGSEVPSNLLFGVLKPLLEEPEEEPVQATPVMPVLAPVPAPAPPLPTIVITDEKKKDDSWKSILSIIISVVLFMFLKGNGGSRSGRGRDPYKSARRRRVLNMRSRRSS